MYIYSRDLLPECFENLFSSNNQVHDHNTRAAAKYRPHTYMSNQHKTILYPRSGSENMELSSFIDNKNKYHFFFQKKIDKIFD
jgi:hypothetical protein